MPSLVSVAILTVPIILLYCAYIIIYRLLFHPLAKIPGPRAAAATWLHEFYFDCLLGGGGQYAFEIQQMHKKYGPLVRITPNEVHINGQITPEFFDVLYQYATKLDKDEWYYYPFGANTTEFSTGSASLHRTRRGALANYFSKSNVRGYEQMVLDNIQHLRSRFEERREKGEVVNVSDAYRCLSIDVATSFTVPHTNTMLSSPNFSADFHKAIKDYTMLATWQRHLRIVFNVMLAVPDWVIERTGEGGVQLVEFFRNFERQANVALGRKGVPPDGEKASILDTLVVSPDLHESDRRFKRIVEQARGLVAAGTETVGATLSILTFYLAANSAIRDKLWQEIRSVKADAETGLLDVKTVEKLPYVQACINEALRISCPVTGRMPRINPREPTTYKTPGGETYTLPPGTIMSMSQPDLHFNADIFPDPHAYKPERWLDANEEMHRYLVAFGKGTRSCVGMELAKMELLLAVGNVFGEFRFELFETTERDVSFAHDFFVPVVPSDSKGVRVKIH